MMLYMLTADTMSGVKIVKTLGEIDNQAEMLTENEFYDSLNNLGRNDIVATIVSLSVAKRIHKDYGINR